MYFAWPTMLLENAQRCQSVWLDGHIYGEGDELGESLSDTGRISTKSKGLSWTCMNIQRTSMVQQQIASQNNDTLPCYLGHTHLLPSLPTLNTYQLSSLKLS